MKSMSIHKEIQRNNLTISYIKIISVFMLQIIVVSYFSAGFSRSLMEGGTRFSVVKARQGCKTALGSRCSAFWDIEMVTVS